LPVTLARPCPYFLELTSFVTFSPNHGPTLERWTYRDGCVLRATQHLWPRLGNIVCNGAFLLTSWEFKRHIWLARNPRYWGAASIALRSIEALITSDPGTGLSNERRLALARHYLQRSGFDRSADQRALEIAFPPELEQRRLAEAIQAMWESALGIPVTLRSLESKVLSTRIRDLDYDIARSDWFGDDLDPSTFVDMFITGSGQNRTGWSNAGYDCLIATAAAEPHDARRFALLADGERILCVDELPIIPIFFRRGNYLLSPRVTGLNDNVRDVLQIHRARRD
jgi:ABC-type oligopeptide transport system substrate-binding subunit